MNKQFMLIKILIMIWFLLALSLLLTGCQQQENTGFNTKQPEFIPDHLTITGNGVERTKVFTLSELKSMEDAQVNECYSIVNDWPTKKFMVGKGIKITSLLKTAGIKPDAQTIVVWAADGYNATFTRAQLKDKRFFFPGLLEGIENGAKEVQAILAWEYREGTDDLSQTVSGNLRLILGQKGLNDSTAPVCVKDIAALEVMTEAPGCWEKVNADPVPGKIKPGTSVYLNHPHQDKVKIYYTIDGSTPDEKSLLYNPSTSYFQPELIKPITINNSMIIKAIAIGFGKYNSEVTAFAYEVE